MLEDTDYVTVALEKENSQEKELFFNFTDLIGKMFDSFSTKTKILKNEYMS